MFSLLAAIGFIILVILMLIIAIRDIVIGLRELYKNDLEILKEKDWWNPNESSKNTSRNDADEV